MPGKRLHHVPSTEQIAKLIGHTREVTANAVALLTSHPKPDSFAGRKTQEPFPAENDQPDRWANCKELQFPI